MSIQPSFPSPAKALEFIRICLDQGDASRLYGSFSEAPSDFWKDRIIQCLQQIEAAESLERVFLEDGRITSFPERETVLFLGGHHPRSQYLHIKLVKKTTAWVLESIHVCR
jgi:hypothetical protein